jgi:hypothetical protein
MKKCVAGLLLIGALISGESHAQQAQTVSPDELDTTSPDAPSPISSDELKALLDERYPGASIDNVIIFGKDREGRSFNFLYPEVEFKPTPDAEMRGFPLTAAASPVAPTYGECAQPVWHTESAGFLFILWCVATYQPYEAKRDYRILYANGDYVFWGSQLLDCGDPFDYAQMPPVVRYYACK